jgi:RNA polymerase sigma-70 factor (ECF subfamily)
MKKLAFEAALNPVPQVYHPAHSQRHILERHAFDQDYVSRLTQRDPEIEKHFTRYFGDLLVIKLRSRLRSGQLVEDVRQETFLRVLHVLNKRGIQHPERLGAFVNSVCENILSEFFRAGNRYQQAVENAPEPADQSASAELESMSEERKTLVRAALSQLSNTDQVILRKAFLEEQDKDEICRELGIRRSNLRVRIHRALERIRAVIRCGGENALHR